MAGHYTYPYYDEESSIGSWTSSNLSSSTTSTNSSTTSSTNASQISLLKPVASYQPGQSLAEKFPRKAGSLPTIADETGEVKGKHSIAHALPNKKGSRWYRHLRYTLLATYQRLFSIVCIANVAVLIGIVAADDVRKTSFSYSTLTTAVAANLFVALLARHENFVNVLFLAVGALPASTPLIFRKWAAKVYAYGGMHSGCALAAIAWYIAFTGLVIKHLVVPPFVHPALAALTFVTISLLVSIVVFALPSMRVKFHDSFEVTHRFCGWTVVVLFWAQIFLLVWIRNGMSMSGYGAALVKAPGFWFQILITLLVIYPWLLLRRRTIRPEKLSDHAIRLHFDDGNTSYCQGLRLTDRPLMETHAFAPIPNGKGEKGFSVIISNAGDWTKSVIQDGPTQIWTRGGPQYGAVYVASLFRKVVVIATGSGIAPCISLFRGHPGLQYRVLWSTPNPLETYGQGIIDEVTEADKNATIIDTRKSGRPDLVRLAHTMYTEADAEAVVIISNAKVTRKVVYGLESRGVPIFAPIFDS